MSTGLSQYFGYVTDEDRDKWERAREARAKQNAKPDSMRKRFSNNFSATLMDFNKKNVYARLMAAHKVNEQSQFEEMYDKSVTRSRRGRTIIEETSYSAKEDRKEVDGMEY